MTLSQPVAEAVVFGLAITLVWSGLVGAARRLPPGPRRDAAREALRWCLAVTLGLALMFVVATVWSWASLQAADRVTSGRATTTFLRGVWRTVLALPLFGALPTLGFLGAMAVGRWIGREARLPSAAVSVGRVAFGAAGYHGVSMEDIASGLGISSAALYRRRPRHRASGRRCAISPAASA